MPLRRSTLVVATLVVLLAALVFSSGGHDSEGRRNTAHSEAAHPRARRLDATARTQPVTHEVVVDDTAVDLGSIVERTHFAFQPTPDGHIGGDAAYKATITGRTIRFEPELPASNGQMGVRGAAITLATQEVSRDGKNLVTSSAAFARTREGTLEASYGQKVIERLRNTSAGLEQEWLFEAAPSGNSDLVVVVDNEGQSFVTANRSGIHLADTGTGLGVVYSHAAWIDALGTATDIPVGYVDGRLVMRVPAALVDSSEYPAVLDPTVGPEFGVDNPIDSVASMDQWTPAIGHSGEANADFLVVWRDARRSVAGYNSDIFGAHVNRNGAVIEPEGFIISDNAEGGDHSNPVARWDTDASRYVVVFTRTLNGLQEILASTLVGALGQTPTGAVTVTSTASMHADYATISDNHYTTGNVTAIAWQQDNGIWVAECHFTVTLTFFCQAPFQVRTNVSGQHQYVFPRIAGSHPYFPGWGTNFLLVSQDTRNSSATADIVGDVIDTNFAIAASFPIQLGALNHAAGAPDVAFFGSSGTWIVVFDFDAGGFGTNYDVQAKEVSLTGSVSPVPINLATGSLQQSSPAVTGYGPGGTQGFATWKEGPGPTGPFQIAGVRVTSPLSTVPPAVFFGGDAVGYRAPVHQDDFSRYFLVWADQRDKVNLFTRQYDVYGSRVDYNGTRLDGPGGFLITKAINSEIMPAVALCGSNYLVAWSDSRNGYYNRDLYASLLSSSGSILVSPIAIAIGAGNQDSPAIACNGTNFYVVWADERNGNRDVYGSMIDGTTGQVLNPGGVAIGATTAREDHPAIAYGGGNFKVVFDAADVFISHATISGVTGALLSGPTIMTGREQNTYPDIAFNGTNFWVVWQRKLSTSLDIAGASLTPSGTVGTIITIENQTANQRYPKVAWDPGKGLYTVVYEDDRNVPSTDILARRVSPTGIVDPAFGVANEATNELSPRIVTRAPLLQEVVYSSTDDVFGQFINNGATSGPKYAIAPGATIRETTPAIACSSSTSCIVPYRSLDLQSINNPIDRIRARLASYP